MVAGSLPPVSYTHLGARLLRRGEGASTLLRQIGEDALYLVPAAMRGGRLGALLVLSLIHISLQEVAELYEVEELRILALGVSVNHRYGGNTSDLLDSIVKLIHEREKLSRQLHAMTGETRISAYVLAGVPSALGGYILASNPGYLLNMWADGTGRFLLLASLGLQLLGCYALWRMLKSV